MNVKLPSGAPGDKTVSGGKIANRLVALSSAAVLTVYSAGYLRTRTAAQQLEAAERPRVVIPGAPVAPGPGSTPMPPAKPATPTPPGTAAPRPAASIASVATKPVSKGAATKATQIARPAAAPVVTPAAPAVVSPRSVDATTVADVAKVEVTPVVEPPAAPTAPPAPVYKDGTYSGWGTSRHGDIQATVVIESGRIASAVISQCWTRYSCSWVAHLQGQVVTRQSPEVDWVSGATQSVNAF